MRRAHIRPSPILVSIGNRKETLASNHTNMPRMGRPNCLPCFIPRAARSASKASPPVPMSSYIVGSNRNWSRFSVCFLCQPPLSPEQNRSRWLRWQEGLQLAPGIGEDMPPLRLLLVLDNLSGHHTPSFVMWLCGTRHHAPLHASRRLLA